MIYRVALCIEVSQGQADADGAMPGGEGIKNERIEVSRGPQGLK